MSIYIDLRFVFKCGLFVRHPREMLSPPRWPIDSKWIHLVMAPPTRRFSSEGDADGRGVAPPGVGVWAAIGGWRRRSAARRGEKTSADDFVVVAELSERRRRLLRGRRDLLPRLPVRVGERPPVPSLGRRDRATLPDPRRRRRRAQLLQERALQASPVVPRVEKPAAALGILRHSPMRNAPNIRVGAAHRDPTHRPNGTTCHVGTDHPTPRDHPTTSDAKERRFLVALGKSALNQSDALEQTFRVAKIVVRPDFDNRDGNYDNDVALLKLKSKEDGRCARESRGVRAACLPAPGQKPPAPGSACEIAGFGKEKHGLWYHSQLLRQARVDLLADDVCRRDDYYGDKINGNMLCAGRPDWTRDACEGDSGGPLVCPADGRLVLVGVISWGEGCARERRPGVYAKVINYRRWIRQHARV
ncbi:hepatocyte growth factor activator-like isoform X10 [Phyllopteryx taeniolatus]|uniref:hepatocyte growth factor activator-like isoform X10 n=1 Tax=Phyllopteryx taeniolatus TaxID=161469 RepID=UPI002AD483B7|nr:hepatocyte growth factor activator-like isoform X10 [Phyllopteryx taeniolatus]